jgi:hypothetical protein
MWQYGGRKCHYEVIFFLLKNPSSITISNPNLLKSTINFQAKFAWFQLNYVFITENIEEDCDRI